MKQYNLTNQELDWVLYRHFPDNAIVYEVPGLCSFGTMDDPIINFGNYYNE